MSGRGQTGLSCVSVMNSMSKDPSASYSRPGNEQKDPLLFRQLMEMPTPCRLSQRAHHLESLEHGIHPSGKESRMTTLRFPMNSHFPSWHVVVTCSLEHLNSTTCDLVRSSSRKILLGRGNNFLLALRARSRSSANLKRRNRVEPNPIQALSRATSWRSRWSLRNDVPITMGFEVGRGRGSPLTLRFNSCARLVRSSMSLACTTS